MSQRGRRREPSPDDSVGIFWLTCKSCNGWDIFENTGLPGPYNEKACKKASFTCRYCKLKRQLDDLCNDLHTIKNQINKVDVEKWCDVVKKLPDDLKETKDQMDKLFLNHHNRLDSEIAGVKATISVLGASEDKSLTAPQLRQVTSEMKEIEARKHNLIISGLPESEDDVDDFIQFCNESHDLTSQVRRSDFESTERVGKKGSVPRLLRIRLASLTTRRVILTMHTKRTYTTDPIIFVRPDLTKTQQELDKNLRTELREKGKDRYQIHRGKVVLRQTIMEANNPVPQKATGKNSTKANPSQSPSKIIQVSAKVEVPQEAKNKAAAPDKKKTSSAQTKQSAAALPSTAPPATASTSITSLTHAIGGCSVDDSETASDPHSDESDGAKWILVGKSPKKSPKKGPNNSPNKAI